jgi:hypothetical protein
LLLLLCGGGVVFAATWHHGWLCVEAIGGWFGLIVDHSALFFAYAEFEILQAGYVDARVGFVLDLLLLLLLMVVVGLGFSVLLMSESCVFGVGFLSYQTVDVAF